MSVKILQGDCIDQMKALPDESVHCCVTSPPYWGLRDYGVEGQLGLEKTPEEYVAKMVAVFREVWRVLRKDGTVFINLGDSYAHNGPCGGSSPDGSRKYRQTDAKKQQTMGYSVPSGLKPKDLVGIPWRVAFALQSDGWYLRQDIVWNKPNPMPESVTDRCTKSHEYIFLLTKSAKYFYDAEAIKEKSVTSDDVLRDRETTKLNNVPGRKRMEGLTTNNYSMRNRRSVWTITMQPYSESHFATFPEELPKLCIMAGTSERGCCPKCGGPWEGLVENTKEYQDFVDAEKTRRENRGMRDGMPGAPGITRGTRNKSVSKETQTLGWQPTCECNAGEPVSCTILAPFAGSGTVGKVAEELGRNSILIELNSQYIEMIKRRTQQQGLFCSRKLEHVELFTETKSL